MAQSIPRGIQVVQWANDDGTKSVRYRVRIKRKAFQADKLFAELDEAVEFLADSKSTKGRAHLVEEERKRQEIAALIAARNSQFNLRGYLRLWEGAHLPLKERLADLPYNERKRAGNEYSRINTICETPVEYQLAYDMTEFQAIAQIWPTGKFGELKLGQLSTRTALSYIRNRRNGDGKKPISFATIKRDLAFLSSFFSWLVGEYPNVKGTFPGNPFESEEVRSFFRKKSVSKEMGIRRDVTFETFGGQEAEDRLFEELRKCRNPEMVQIVSLALATGQRRGEIIGLTWDRVFPEHIRLMEADTKTGKAREVYLSDEAKKILASIERKPELKRVFSYTPEGFKSVWARVRERKRKISNCRSSFRIK